MLQVLKAILLLASLQYFAGALKVDEAEQALSIFRNRRSFIESVMYSRDEKADHLLKTQLIPERRRSNANKEAEEDGDDLPQPKLIKMKPIKTKKPTEEAPRKEIDGGVEEPTVVTSNGTTQLKATRRQAELLNTMNLFRHDSKPLRVRSLPNLPVPDITRAAIASLTKPSLQPQSESEANQSKPAWEDKPPFGLQSVKRPLTPNQRLDKCCRDQPALHKCQFMCSYDQYTKTNLLNAYLRGQCSPGQLGGVLHCTNRKHDHRPCCAAKGVPSLCDFFCASAIVPGPKPHEIFKFLPCTDQLPKILTCFKEYDKANPVYVDNGS